MSTRVHWGHLARVLAARHSDGSGPPVGHALHAHLARWEPMRQRMARRRSQQQAAVRRRWPLRLIPDRETAA